MLADVSKTPNQNRRADNKNPASAFACTSTAWKTHNGQVTCGSIGGKAGALELADAGGWTHAYQEVPVVADAAYTVSVGLFALKEGVCDGTAKVVWCSPSVVVCPGTYNSLFYNEGGCYVGLAPKGNGTWETLSASFTPTVATVTVYITQVRPARHQEHGAHGAHAITVRRRTASAVLVCRSRRHTARG